MTSVNRRRFVQLTGGAVTASMLSASIARAAAIPANRRTGSLDDIEHIVVLMQENRSFDHYFGTLRGVRGFGDPHPVTLASGKSVWHQSDGTKDILPFHPDAADLGLQFIQDLPHDWNTGHAAWNNGKYDQWVPAKGSTTMAHLNRQDIPFHYALADAFTICDDYHCSMLGPTDPNRYYMWTGYVGNDGQGGGPVLGNEELGYGWTTYPERLEASGVSWKIYQDAGDGLDGPGSWGWTSDAYIGNYGDNSLLYFHQYQNAAPGNPLYDKARTGTNAKGGQGFFDVLKADVASGNLPQISWIVAPEAFTEHPNWPANYGAWYVSQVLDALTANPDVWSKTALFITYDENDGFFDHVVPAFAPTSRAQGLSTVSTFDEDFQAPAGDTYVSGPYGLGLRVPMLVVSPWSKGGWVCSEVFDHTSIIRFMERRFGVFEPNIAPWRRVVCGDLTAAFDFSDTETGFPALPSTAGYFPPDQNRHPSYVPTPPANPELPAQESGVRYARPLPYNLAADAAVWGGNLQIDFTNPGQAGAAFFVTSTTHAAGPWTYTVESGKSLSDTWDVAADSQGAYAFVVHGPNGFLRRFEGKAATAGVEVATAQVGDEERVQLTLTNNGTAPVRLTVTDGYGIDKPDTHYLRPGSSATHNAHLHPTNGWYDLTVTSDQDSSFVRQVAGHVENGKPSTSDPAIGAW